MINITRDNTQKLQMHAATSIKADTSHEYTIILQQIEEDTHIAL